MTRMPLSAAKLTSARCAPPSTAPNRFSDVRTPGSSSESNVVPGEEALKQTVDDALEVLGRVGFRRRVRAAREPERDLP